ncbi:hypothetical protein E3N88_42785 [Mikania micrantha]|uniref:Uncharacterized protein n=1 Tax=Mikania micrantha TaxID=192012 RepID=A0A5N6LGT3_9ASTR|nr:hypothetical protein E3N88_42785 [Mikania micrantha]
MELNGRTEEATRCSNCDRNNRRLEIAEFGTTISVEAVIDMLLFKGIEELNNITEHSKQRHHIIGQYVVARMEKRKEMVDVERAKSCVSQCP